MKRILNMLLPASTRRLSKRWMMVGVILASLIVGGGLTYAANTIIVDIGGGVGVEGSIIVTDPLPTADDIVVLSVPDFACVVGNTAPISGDIVVQNNSGYDLTLGTVSLKTSPSSIGSLVQNLDGFNPVLIAGGTQTITVILTLDDKTGGGQYSYSGSLEYSY